MLSKIWSALYGFKLLLAITLAVVTIVVIITCFHYTPVLGVVVLSLLVFVLVGLPTYAVMELRR